MKKLLMIAGATLSLAASAKPYGEAGCGLGTLVMGKEGNQVLVATTNGTFGNQTFGISTGTLNCVDDGAVAEHRALDLYLDSNRVALASDASRGQGESVVALAKLLGCRDSAALGSALQRNYSTVFPRSNVGSAELSRSVRGLVRSEPALAAACPNVG